MRLCGLGRDGAAATARRRRCKEMGRRMGKRNLISLSSVQRTHFGCFDFLSICSDHEGSRASLSPLCRGLLSLLALGPYPVRRRPASPNQPTDRVHDIPNFGGQPSVHPSEINCLHLGDDDKAFRFLLLLGVRSNVKLIGSLTYKRSMAGLDWTGLPLSPSPHSWSNKWRRPIRCYTITGRVCSVGDNMVNCPATMEIGSKSGQRSRKFRPRTV